MKKILGLDLGTNSIGWAVLNGEQTENGIKYKRIEADGSRIIPMDAAVLGDFDMGNTKSQTADRTVKRGARRLHERYLLRRERLHRVLSVMDFLPKHYAEKLDKYGHFLKENEPKLAWNNGRFLFMDSFQEMLADFATNQPELVADGKKVPLDWTIYYLRKKALTQAITKEELAWILLQFNQKRGYNQLRDEEEEQSKNQLVEFHSLKVVDVEDSGDKKGDDIWYNVKLENGWIYKRASSIPLDWVGKVKDFIVTTDLNDDGTVKTDKDGKEKRSFRAPKEDDWTLLKKKTEYNIDISGNTVGEYIYNSLLSNPDQKIIGKLVRTIERKYFKDELKAIINKQKEFIPELNDSELYAACIEELYPSNDDYRNSIASRDFTYLLVEDVLFYQRPLKSKKSTIANCPYESHFDKDGNEYPIKCVAKSNPFFQEFRLWQFVQNLKIYQRERIVNDGQMDLFGNVSTGKLETDVDVTNEFIRSEEELVALFDFLNDKKDIKQESLLKDYFKIKKPKGKDSELPYRWNYVEDKTYPCNKTRAVLLAKLTKEDKTKLTKELEYALWHLLYSVNSKTEIDAVFAENKQNNLKGIYHQLLEAGFSDESIENLKKAKFDEKDYGSYSEKAIKKLLALMRMGKYWNQDNIDAKTLDRIEKIISGEYDEKIRNRVREKAINLTDVSLFRGLPVWLACYIVYDRHSEASDIQKWEKPEDIDKWLKDFKQHSLRNPIVEQVVTETMRTVRDIWKQVGSIDEIHVELGREMKNTAEDRAKITLRNNENEQSNLRIKALLSEFLNSEYNIDNVRPYSPTQQEILKIYEENALGTTYKVTRNKETKKSTIKVEYAPDVPDDIIRIVTKLNNREQPTKNEFMRYKLWLEQKYRSPYTGQMIPLSKLFTTAYEIEHVIPQSRYFDDSFSNKVICEAEVNRLKDNLLGFEFIKNHHGEKVTLTGGKVVEIFSTDDYQDFVRKNYAKNPSKMKNLLLDDIPDKFIERQLNDSRYISKYIKGILSNIVREKDENGNLEQEAVSKSLISCNGNITDRLKKDWGMNDVWNRIILPRFIRMNELTNSTDFTTINTSGEIIPAMPLELQKGFNKKRIDHRHHAMDAIVIACTTRKHIQYLNSLNSKTNNRAVVNGLAKDLCRFEEKTFKKKVKNAEGVWVDEETATTKPVPVGFLKPWETFTQDAQRALENIVVSFKQNLRVINKTVNHYQHFENGKKVMVKQEKGESWAIRKSMHKDTVFGEVNLRFKKEVSLNEALKDPKAIVNKDFKEKVLELLNENRDAKYIKKYVEDNKDVWSDINLKKIEVYYFTKDTKERYFATREPLDTSFNKKKIEDSVTDTGIQKILLAHLCKYDRLSFTDKSKQKEEEFEILVEGRMNSIEKENLTIETPEVKKILDETNNKFYYKGKKIESKDLQEKNCEEAILNFEEKKSTILKSEKLEIKIKEYPDIAFSPDGIDELNQNIVALNKGKAHKPIYKVRRFESGNKFPIGQTGNKGKKFVESDKGTKLYTFFYNKQEDDGTITRKLIPISFIETLKFQKEFGRDWIQKMDDKIKTDNHFDATYSLIFTLSPMDLVYVPTESEISANSFDYKPTNIYKVVSLDDENPNFILASIASMIIDKQEFTRHNKTSRSLDGRLIKNCCVPIKVDRLGNIIEINNYSVE